MADINRASFEKPSFSESQKESLKQSTELTNCGLDLELKNQLSAATDKFTKALKVDEAAFGKYGKAVADDCHNLADVYSKRHMDKEGVHFMVRELFAVIGPASDKVLPTNGDATSVRGINTEGTVHPLSGLKDSRDMFMGPSCDATSVPGINTEGKVRVTQYKTFDMTDGSGMVRGVNTAATVRHRTEFIIDTSKSMADDKPLKAQEK